MARLIADFETRSKCDLKTSGAHRYAADPSTEIMCLAWKFRGAKTVSLWHPAYPNATENGVVVGLPEEGRSDLEMLFLELADESCEIEAHNAMFERVIWRFVGQKKNGFEPVRESQWRCSAAKSASFALPRKLEDAADALGLKHQKDMDGHALMMKCSQPAAPPKAKKPKKGQPALPPPAAREWNEEIADLKRIFEYCKKDVLVEEELSSNLRDLPPAELACWQLDQTINQRGVFCDRKLIERALSLVEGVIANANVEITAITDGTVTKVSQIGRIKKWVDSRGVYLPDCTAPTLLEILNDPFEKLPDDVRRVLELRKSAGQASTNKYAAFAACICDDNFVHDLLAYYGANTGRWAGRLVQPQNFAKPKAGLGKIKMEQLVDDIMRYDAEGLAMLYGDAMDVLGTAARGVIMAEPNTDLYAADYAAIEARVTYWFGEEEEQLELLRSGKDIYREMAAGIFGKPAGEIPKDSDERQAGKAAVLGLGFKMGALKYQETCAAAPYNIDLPFELCEKIVKGFRAKCHKLVDFWKEIEEAAIEAVFRGRDAEPVSVRNGKLLWAVRGRFLHVRLPSGRLLSYCEPRVVAKEVTVERKDEQGNVTGTYSFWSNSLRFKGVNSLTKQWEEQHTYGGSLTENVVQATARDIMRDAMLRLDVGGKYLPILTVHDEILSKCLEGQGDLKEYEALVGMCPDYLPGLPVKAEGWVGKRFKK